ncbi:MAG: terminase [Muribaculaceae bacterium]
MANKSSDDSKDIARTLFMAGELQTVIATKLKISKQTVNRWVAEGEWIKRRAAQTVSRAEIANNLLLAINNEVVRLNKEKDTSKIAGACDKLSKLASIIEKLDKKANVIDAIEVFMAFGKWMQYRAQSDLEITPELLKAINKYQDLYITEQLNNRLNGVDAN